MRPLPDWFEPDRWNPPPGSTRRRQVSRLMRAVGVADLASLHSFSVEQPETFYRAAEADLGLAWPTPWRELRDSGSGDAMTRWFVGGRTNLTWLALHRWVEGGEGDRPALHWEAEDGTVVTHSYARLAAEVDAVAAGLRAHGVSRGDVVGLYMPPLPEAVVTLFAAARIGAVLAPAFSGYGMEALTERLRLVGAKVLVCADGARRRGETVDMLGAAHAAADAAGCPTVVVVPRVGSSAAREADVPWADLFDHGEEGAFEWFEPEQAWLVAFTSGSTGRPKGAVHCHGRLPYRASVDMAYCLDMSRDSCLYWPSDMGWIIAPLGLVTSFVLGGRHLLHEGVPTHPTPDVMWKLVERHGVTHLGSSPSLLRQLAAAGPDWVEPYDLDSLEVIASAGEPMTSAAWRWTHRHVGRGRLPIMNHTGGTEIGCGLLSGSPVVPMREGRFAGPPPGISVGVLDDSGHRVVDRLGDLAVLAPWPSMTYGFWNEPGRWEATYASAVSGVYLHGDRAVEYADGSWELPGRSDDVMNVGGKRIGPSEYEALALGVEGVTAAAAVGVPDRAKGEAVAILCTSDLAGPAAAALGDTVRQRVEAALGKAFRAAHVMVVDELPLTRSAKVHRRAIRAWLTGAEPGDLSNLENPTSETSIRRAAALVTPSVPAPREGP